MVDEALVEVAVAEAPLPGETESGDRPLVVSHRQGVLVAAVDGLGHGAEAAESARIACAVLEEDPGADLPELFLRAHRRLARKRGVVMSVASFGRDARLTWLGVGNVEGTLLRANAGTLARADSILLLGGVVGHGLPNLRPSTRAVEAGDTLILATDGIHGAHMGGLVAPGSPRRMADRIMSEHASGTDDALVVVARYAG